jgi:hypothetical protein
MEEGIPKQAIQLRKRAEAQGAAFVEERVTA